MKSRWEKPVLERIVEELDPLAVSGERIRRAGLDARLFNCCPTAHATSTCATLQWAYDSLARSARTDERLAVGQPLVKRWTLRSDIYSPTLRRFIEVDEYQHFSRARLTRMLENRFAPWQPLYPVRFWQDIFPRLLARPFRDLDPPHRDEARAYRDEARERLAVLYGLWPTIRLDEFTLKQTGLHGVVNLVTTILKTEAEDGRRTTGL